MLTNICSRCIIISEQMFVYRVEIERERIMKSRRVGITVVAVVALTILFSCAFTMNLSAKEVHKTYTYYTSIEIQDGDNLWDIADQYATASISKQDYIKEVKELNNLSSDDIYEGQYLTVPYYSSELK